MLSTMSLAQDEAPASKDYYFGIHSNQLLKQLLNFGESNSTSNNYFVTISQNDKETGKGLSFGFAIGLNNSNENDSEFIWNQFSSNFRFGYEQKKMISEKWQLTIGYDILSHYRNEKVEIEANTDRFSSERTQKDITIGTGPRGEIGFFINQRILIRTETTLYFQHTFRTTETHVDNPQIPVDARMEKQKDMLQSMGIRLPVVLYFTVRF